jgi:hypothetical protein
MTPDEIAEAQKSESHEQTEDASTAPNHGTSERLKDQKPEPMPRDVQPGEIVPGVVLVRDDSDAGGPIEIKIVEPTE